MDKKQQQRSPSTPLYRMNLYKPDGSVRGDVNKAVLYDLATRFGDLMRLIPSARWVTLDEIVSIVWHAESRNWRKEFTRTRKQIEDGVVEMVDMGVVQTKT